MPSDEHVTRLFGGPGSGKTTALLDRVEDLLNSGVPVEDVLLVSYTRAAASEVRERLAERLDRSPRSLQGTVSTMHAKAYELLDLSSNDVVSESDKEAFCAEYGIDFEDQNSGSRRHSARSTTIGNKIIATSQWVQRTDREVADWYDVAFQWNEEEVRLPPEIDERSLEGNKYTPTWPTEDDRLDVPEAIRAWRSYKGTEGLVGFADMLERVKQRSLVPNVDYLAIDEFQDITTLQYLVYEEWKAHMERVLIAGDDDQVVYAWQGADPQLLLEEGGEDVILGNSYRLPENVLSVVNREVRHITERQEKDLDPRSEGGVVEGRPNETILGLVRELREVIERTDESVMVLFRARYQLFQFVEEFVGEGIPFRLLTDQRMWTDRFSEYVSAIESLDAGESVTGREAQRLAGTLDSAAFGPNERQDLYDELDAREEAADAESVADIEIEPGLIDEYVPFLPGPGAVAEMTWKASSLQKRTLSAYFDGEYGDVGRERVRAGTIHSAKGREADHVFLATDLTEKVVEQMAASIETGGTDLPDGVDSFDVGSNPVPMLTDNERRVFYVGMSRARERLVVLENLIGGAPTLPIDVLLDNRPSGISIEEALAEPVEPTAD